MAGKGGGAWKVAYADFVTAMMAFFLVMWIVAQNKPVKEAVAGYFKDPLGTEGKPSGTGTPTAIERPSKPNIDPNATVARKSMMVMTDEGDKTAAGTVIPFTEVSADLDEAAQARLNELVPLLLGKANKIEIRGHAAARLKRLAGSSQDPWQLCYARCLATFKYLEKQGVEPERIRMSQAGVFEPFTLALEPGSTGQNSRVEIYLLSEYAKDLKGVRPEKPGRTRTKSDSKDSTSCEPKEKAKAAPASHSSH